MALESWEDGQKDFKKNILYRWWAHTSENKGAYITSHGPRKGLYHMVQ